MNSAVVQAAVLLATTTKHLLCFVITVAPYFVAAARTHLTTDALIVAAKQKGETYEPILFYV